MDKFMKSMVGGVSALALLSLSAPAYAQTFTSTDTPLSIPDNNRAGITSTITVPNLGVITDVDVAVDANHTWVGDLTVTVTSPSATTVRLIDRPGFPVRSFGNPDNLRGTYVFDDAGILAISETGLGGTTTPGTYLVDQSTGEALADFNGELVGGVWQLGIVDRAAGDRGTLNLWQLLITVEAVDPAFIAPTLQSVMAVNTAQLLGSMDERRSALASGKVSTSGNAYGSTNGFRLNSDDALSDARWGAWIRAGGLKSKSQAAITNLFIPGTSAYETKFGYIQAGTSFLIGENADAEYSGSIFAHYGSGSTNYRDGVGAQRGKSSTKAKGIGAALTAEFNNGFYGDLAAIYTWQDIEINTTAGATGSTTGGTLSFSIETGYRYDYQGMFVMIPQAQLIYQRNEIDGFVDSIGTTYGFNNASHLQGRLGLGIEKTSNVENATVVLKAASHVAHDFRNESNAIVNGTILGFSDKSTSALLSAGLDVVPNGGNLRFGVNGEYNIPLNDRGARSYGVSAQLKLQF